MVGALRKALSPRRTATQTAYPPSGPDAFGSLAYLSRRTDRAASGPRGGDDGHHRAVETPRAGVVASVPYGLSEREREVVDLVLQGASTKEISQALYISEYTVQEHLSNAFD